MANEPVQDGAPADGHGIVIWAETLADPAAPTAAEVNGGTRITYGLTSDGFVHDVTINDMVRSRYTLDQELIGEGTKRHRVTTRYVYHRDTPNTVEGILGVKGTEGFLIHALGFPNDHVFEAGDKLNAVIPARVGTSTDVPPTSNSELAKQMIPEITGEVLQEVAVAAGA